MKKNWKSACVVVIMIAVVGLWACSDKGNDTTGPSPVTYTPPSLPVAESAPPPTANNPPAEQPPEDGGNVYTIISGADVMAKLECRDQEPGWFIPDGFQIRIRLDKFLDHEWRFISNLFWQPEPSCSSENMTDQPSKGTSWRRDGKFMIAKFVAPKECGRYQWDLVLRDETAGKGYIIWYGMLNTGNENCEEECVPKWKELEPEITNGEWGECIETDTPAASVATTRTCSQSREVRTVIKEKNSCTGKTRVKSDETTKETRSCDCACEEEWTELKPEITYGEWSECEADNGSRESCSRFRKVRTVIKEKNSCTGEMRVKSDETTKESEPCDCPCSDPGLNVKIGEPQCGNTKVKVWTRSDIKGKHCLYESTSQLDLNQSTLDILDPLACKNPGSCTNCTKKNQDWWAKPGHSYTFTWTDCKDCKDSYSFTVPPAEPFECDFGYEFNPRKCKCEPKDICHVSNGGQPGECDWNLQEQNKKYTPGHGLHMDPANQCPPDYFGKCDGRYLTNPHSCQTACQEPN